MNIRKNGQGGFTLIELLIVIVVIAILSSIVLVSITGVREGAVDAANRAELAQLSILAEKYRFGEGDFENFCTSTDNNDSAQATIAVINKRGGAGTADADPKVVACNVSDNKKAWAAFIALQDPGTDYNAYCVDSTGKRGNVNQGTVSGGLFTTAPTVTACPNIEY